MNPDPQKGRPLGRSRVRWCAACIALGLSLSLVAGASARGPLYVPGRLIVGYAPPVASPAAEIRSSSGLGVSSAPAQSDVPQEQVLRLPPGHSVAASLPAVRRVPGITFAVPDYIAHAAGAWYPNDPGRAHRRGGWETMQWNFLAGAGVNAPEAWANLIADGRPGAQGIKVAVLDTGVAYRDWRRFVKMPDFGDARFVDPCDLVAGRIRHGRCTNTHPLDRNGHGTFVTAELAEATNNRRDLTGLAYGASIMPIRVLDANGDGGSAGVAAGIRYAVAHGARVINLSLQFGQGLSASDIPNVMSALQYANDHNVVVVAAAGNDSSSTVAYPARARTVISVGATTEDRCLASYSDSGQGLDLVAPGGGRDADLKQRNCHPGRRLPSIYQLDFRHVGEPRSFGYSGDWFGTSMAAPEVSAAAAMILASGVIGSHPRPAAVLARLEQTATPLGGRAPDADYGYGLLNIGAATAPTVTATGG
jgi:serine protease